MLQGRQQWNPSASLPIDERVGPASLAQCLFLGTALSFSTMLNPAFDYCRLNHCLANKYAKVDATIMTCFQAGAGGGEAGIIVVCGLLAYALTTRSVARLWGGAARQHCTRIWWSACSLASDIFSPARRPTGHKAKPAPAMCNSLNSCRQRS